MHKEAVAQRVQKEPAWAPKVLYYNAGTRLAIGAAGQVLNSLSSLSRYLRPHDLFSSVVQIQRINLSSWGLLHVVARARLDTSKPHIGVHDD